MQSDSSPTRPSRQGAVVILSSFAVFMTAIVLTLASTNRPKPNQDVPVSEDLPASLGLIESTDGAETWDGGRTFTSVTAP